MNVTLTGKFVQDWEPASEDLYAEAENGSADIAYIGLIEKIDNAPRIKHGKIGFSIDVDLTDSEIKLLKDEAKYRMEFWSLLYQECKSDIDNAAHNAAKKLFLSLNDLEANQVGA